MIRWFNKWESIYNYDLWLLITISDVLKSSNEEWMSVQQLDDILIVREWEPSTKALAQGSIRNILTLAFNFLQMFNNRVLILLNIVRDFFPSFFLDDEIGVFYLYYDEMECFDDILLISVVK